MNIRRLLYGAAAAGALAFAGVSALSASAATGVGGGPIAQTVMGSGSDTTQFMMQGIDQIYRFADGCAQIPGQGAPTTTQWLDFSCQSPDPISATHTANTTLGSETITLTSGTNADIQVGDQVTGPGIPTGCEAPCGFSTYSNTVFVGGKVSTNQIFLSNSPVVSDTFLATATATQTGVTLSFSHVRQTENYAHDRPVQAWFLGSSNGIKQLCGQGLAPARIDYARSSRGLKNSDCAGLQFVAYARDGISWEIFAAASGDPLSNFNNPDPLAICAVNTICLTQAQLKGIFATCTITDWHTVDSNAPVNTTIHVYTAQPGSGTRSTFDGFLGTGASSDACIPPADKPTHIIPENNNGPLLIAADMKTAIYPFSFGVWTSQVNGANNSHLGAIDNVAPTPTTISDLSFPWGRFLYNVYCGTGSSCPGGTATTAVVNYIGEGGWLCKLGRHHFNDPLTGLNYNTEIFFQILNSGFIRPTAAAVGGGSSVDGYCRLFNSGHPTP